MQSSLLRITEIENIASSKLLSFKVQCLAYEWMMGLLMVMDEALCFYLIVSSSQMTKLDTFVS